MSQAQGTNSPGYRIVVGVDYSELSRLALCTALNLAEKQRGTLHVLTVAEGYGPPLPKDLIDEEKRLFIDEARRALQKYVEEQAGAVLGDPGSVRIEIHAEIGNAADHILQLAHTANADLIVIGIAGRRPLAEVLLGTAAQRVLRHAGCSVLVVRPRPADKS